MNSSHSEIVFANQNAQCFCTMPVIGILIQMAWEAYMMASSDINMKYTYPIYLVLNILFFIPQVLCLGAFFMYKNGDSKVRRSFLPMASLIMIGFSIVYLFQSVFMLLKNENKSFTVTGREDPFKKPAKKPEADPYGRYNSNQFNANNEADKDKYNMDEPDRDNAFGPLTKSIFLYTILIIFWAVCYFVLNDLVQRLLPVHQRMQKINDSFIPRLNLSRSSNNSSSRIDESASSSSGAGGQSSVLRDIVRNRSASRDQKIAVTSAKNESAYRAVQAENELNTGESFDQEIEMADQSGFPQNEDEEMAAAIRQSLEIENQVRQQAPAQDPQSNLRNARLAAIERARQRNNQ